MLKNLFGKIKAIIKLREFLAANPQRTKFIGILAVALILPLTVVAALTVQNLQQKASQNGGIEISDINGNSTVQTVDPNIFLEITLPENWVLPPNSPQGINFIKKTYAAFIDDDGFPYAAPSLSITNSAPIHTGDSLSFTFAGFQSNAEVTIGVVGGGAAIFTADSNGSSTAAFSSIGETAGNYTLQASDSFGHVATALFEVTSVSTPSDVPTPIPSAPPISTTPEPSVITPEPSIISPTPTRESEPVPSEIISPSPTPAPNILRAISIENKDADGSTGGSSPIRITVNNAADLAHIAWKLNDLLPGQTQAPRTIQVTLIADSSTMPLTSTINLTQTDLQLLNLSPSPAATQSSQLTLDAICMPQNSVRLQAAITPKDQEGEMSIWINGAKSAYLQNEQHNFPGILQAQTTMSPDISALSLEAKFTNPQGTVTANATKTIDCSKPQKYEVFPPPLVRITVDRSRSTEKQIGISLATDSQFDLSSLRLVYGTTNELDENQNFAFVPCNSQKECKGDFGIPIPKEVSAGEKLNIVAFATGERIGFQVPFGFSFEKGIPITTHASTSNETRFEFLGGSAQNFVSQVNINGSAFNMYEHKIYLINGIAVGSSYREPNSILRFYDVKSIDLTTPSPSAPIISPVTSADYDLNHDGSVNCSDNEIIKDQFGQKGPSLLADFNHDGIVDGVDYNMLLRSFAPGETCSTPSPSPSSPPAKIETFTPPSVEMQIDKETAFAGENINIHLKTQSDYALSGIKLIYGTSDELNVNQNSPYLSCNSQNKCEGDLQIKVPDMISGDEKLNIVAFALATGKDGALIPFGFSFEKGIPFSAQIGSSNTKYELLGGSFQNFMSQVKVNGSTLNMYEDKIYLMNDFAVRASYREPNSILRFYEKKSVNLKKALPHIDEILAGPNDGAAGTVFTVTAKTMNLNLDLSMTIINSDNNVLKELALYDDGFHGDKKQQDGLYGNTFDSKGFSDGVYSVGIKSDGTTIKSTTVRIGKLECAEVIPGQNNLSDNRINIVFVGYEYSDFNKFKTIVQDAIGYNGQFGGILTQEPFLSNKNKFNFWMVGEIKKNTPAEFKKIDMNGFTKIVVDRYVFNAASACRFPNRQVAMLVNYDFRSFAQMNYFFASIRENLELEEYNWDITVPIHELGHSLGLLQDEYIETGRSSSNFRETMFDALQFLRPDLKRKLNTEVGSLDKCTSSSIYKELRGKGCINPEGCIENYNQNTDEIICKPGLDCNIEMGCFMGSSLGATNSYRFTFNSIMRNHVGAIKTSSPRAFGSINEKFLCDRIKEVTGSAGGICNE